MCDALAELGEEGNEDYLVCNCLHSFIACLSFQVFDFFAGLFALLVYAIMSYFLDASFHISLPLFVLVLFAVAFPSGVIGLLYTLFFSSLIVSNIFLFATSELQHIIMACFPIGAFLTERANLLVIYNTRLTLIVLWSLSWMVFSLLARGDVVGLATSLAWFIGALFYFCGLFVTSKALTYITTHYRGYDDVDPDRVQYIEQMLRDMIDEIRQKELDITAGAIPTSEPTPEQNPEVTVKNPPEKGGTATTTNAVSPEKPQRV